MPRAARVDRVVVARLALPTRILLRVLAAGYLAVGAGVAAAGSAPGDRVPTLGLCVLASVTGVAHLSAADVRVDARGGYLHVVNLVTTWRLPVWSVRRVHDDGLVFLVDPSVPAGRFDPPFRRVDATVLQSSLAARLRGNSRANGAIRRFENARTASPWVDPGMHPPTRRARTGVLWAYVLLPAAAALAGLMVGGLFS
ncbi:hypothetical protein [Pengzhenrongella sp.]|jgi:hypothetical protein|uniref:hypothetical protein n=1 Tax=Pengzhenrongella sp. TaxID=2888820 RepID=UPI002F944BB5